MTKRKIKCSYCGSILFYTDKESDGAAGAEAQRQGFVFKMPFLYSEVSTAFFCDKACCEAWFTENVSEEDREKGKKVINELHARKDDMLEGCIKGIRNSLLPALSEMQEAAEKGKLKKIFTKT